ncbi:MAG TPA: hypothetical protein VGB54_11815 [Allosphingosinicella sp.]|jgi:hypothetical protein
MLGLIGLTLAMIAQPQDDPSVWQDFGRDAQGATILLNPDTVITGDAGPEAMVRVRRARPAANGAVFADYETVFNCSARSATRKLMGERDGRGEIVSRNDEGTPMPPVSAPANSPMGKVLDAVCALASG